VATPEPRPGPTQRPDRFDDSGAAGDPTDDPRRTVAVQPPAVRSQEERPVTALADGQVDRPGSARRERDGNHLAAFAVDHQGPVPALDAQGLDVRTCSLRNPQPVQGQQRDQCVVGRLAEPGGDQQRPKLVAVQPGGMGLVVEAGTADMRGR
jgi:hypothetical protein